MLSVSAPLLGQQTRWPPPQTLREFHRNSDAFYRRGVKLHFPAKASWINPLFFSPFYVATDATAEVLVAVLVNVFALTARWML